MCCRIDAATSVADETCPVNKKRKKDTISYETSSTAADITDYTSTSIQSISRSKKKKKKKKQKQAETKLPTISDERLKAYGINPKKFKYFHKKKLLEEQR